MSEEGWRRGWAGHALSRPPWWWMHAFKVRSRAIVKALALTMTVEALGLTVYYPFRGRGVGQVDFDEKSPIELVQILNDVFAELEPAMAVRRG